MGQRTKQKQRRVDALDIAHQTLNQEVWCGNVVAAAKRRGYTQADAEKIAKQVERIARGLFKQALAITFPEYEQSEDWRAFLDDTVDDAEYNAWLEHIHTPTAENY